MSLTAVALPKRFVLDGRLDEWGDLRPAPGGEGVSPPEDFPLKSAIGQGKPRREAKNAHNPVDAVVRVGLAITEAGIHVAIDFGSAPPSPVTLGLASIDWQTLATTHDDDDSELTSYDDIVRRFTISPKGVELLGESRPLDGAEVVRASEGKTLEVFLPNRWMPRLVDAPLEYLRMSATLDRTLHRRVFDEPWRWVRLPAPVRYEPYAELRERVMTAVLQMGPVLGSTITYHAHDPLHISSATPAQGLTALQPFGTLYEKKASIGDVDVGLGYAHLPFVVAMKAGKLSDVALLTRQEEAYLDPKTDDLGDGQVRGIIERNGEVHVFASTSASIHAWITGALLKEHWTVIIVGKDGKARTWLCDVADGTIYGNTGEPKLFFDASFKSFGWKNELYGTFFEDGKDRVRELSCAWDDKKKVYTARTRFTPPLPP